MRIRNMKKYQHPPKLTAALNAVLHPVTGRLQEYKELLTGEDTARWLDGCSKEVARLCNGRLADNTQGTNTVHFIDP